MSGKYLDYSGLLYFWGKLQNYFQTKLVSGTNIKTVGNQSLLGSGNIDVTGNQLVELTQDEYNALSQAEKENGKAYFITDGEPEALIVNDSLPIGGIIPYGGSTAPTNWLICDGSAVSRTDYSELFEAIGTTYGSGDGSTTFNVPDLKGRTIVGVGESSATGHTNHTLGQSAGEETNTLDINKIPSHNHSSTCVIDFRGCGNSGEGNNPIFNCRTNASVSIAVGNSVNTLGWGNISRKMDRVTLTTGKTDKGGGQPHNNMQPYVVTNYIIKAKDDSLNGKNLEPLIDMIPQSDWAQTDTDAPDYIKNKPIIKVKRYSNVNTFYDSNTAITTDLPVATTIVLGIRCLNRYGWRFIATHGVTGVVHKDNWAIKLTDGGTFSDSYSFDVVYMEYQA